MSENWSESEARNGRQSDEYNKDNRQKLASPQDRAGEQWACLIADGPAGQHRRDGGKTPQPQRPLGAQRRAAEGYRAVTRGCVPRGLAAVLEMRFEGLRPRHRFPIAVEGRTARTPSLR